MSMRSYIPTIDSITQTAEIARLLSDPTRLKILRALFLAESDMCVSDIVEEVGSSQSATSHQLAKLEASDVVLCFRDGQKMCYELTKSPIVKNIEKTLRILSVI